MQSTTDNAQQVILPEIEAMFHAGLQFAYKKTRRHPKMRQYIAGVKSNIEVFHLERISECIKSSEDFLFDFGKSKKQVLWVGTKAAAKNSIRDVGEALQHPYVNVRWLGGTLTNFKMIRGRVTRLEKLEEGQKSGEHSKYTKQERGKIQEEIERLIRSFDGLRKMERLPQALVIVDTNEEITALHEATRLGISTVGIINSDCDPTQVSHAIPSNDNATDSILYVLGRLQKAYEKGMQEGEKEKQSTDGEKEAKEKKNTK